MSLFLDIFGYLTVILHGAALAAQALTVGGIASWFLLVRPLGLDVDLPIRRLLAGSALLLAIVSLFDLALRMATLVGTTQLSIAEAAGADFVPALCAKAMVALIVALLCWRRQAAAGGLMAILAVLLIVAATGTTHAVGRLDGRPFLALMGALHMLGAAVWIGGIPYFLMALAETSDRRGLGRIGKRFSAMAMASVVVLVTTGTFMAVNYVGDWDALYGTAYGLMVMSKIMLLAVLLLLGAMNFRLVDRLAGDAATPLLRLRRFAEAEIGIGFTVFFAAASLTSIPPGVDLDRDRVSFQEIAARLTPKWPSFSTPSHGDLAIPALQAALDAGAAAGRQRLGQAFVPGTGEAPPRNAFDIAWSEYNHHWAGLAVLLIGLAALAERSGRVPWARHWPLLFLGLAAFLFVRSDPENWPLGDISFLDGFRDPEIVQHRLYTMLITVFGIFEWRVRTGRTASKSAALMFPVVTAIAGMLLLTHAHSIGNVREELLIEATHLPMALCGVVAGWSRWVELRADPGAARVASWVWPVCFSLVGLLLIAYRET
ncbi:MAG: copper resistance protein [Alphaproteobacteria bacterium]|nr:copper resistance protein [Alphaproteobacteria bacterium]